MLTGRLLPGLSPDWPPVREGLKRWPGYYAARPGPGGWELMLFEPTPRRERWLLHVGLLVVTLFSTVVAGALLAGGEPVTFSTLPLLGGWWIWVPTSIDIDSLMRGIPFGVTLVAILAVHEAGHYVAARWHSISVTPPYFIPFPPYVSVIGTLGAFIRLRSPVPNRRTLLDIGVAGPLASFIASIPVLAWGLSASRPLAVGGSRDVPSTYLVGFAGEHFWLGSSFLLTGLREMVMTLPAGHVLELHPLAFAGWLGLFVTALNLLPISQLDGGHVLYSLVGKRQKLFAWAFFAALIPLGFLWAGWWIWALLVLVVGRGRVRHPSVFDDVQALDGRRVALGLLAAVVFALCFIPVPFHL